jgi:large subunit ribosomal protein L4
MYPFFKRVKGLCATLSCKLAQDDLKIVDSLDIPHEDPQFLEDLIEERKWGVSVLFVDEYVCSHFMKLFNDVS